MGTEPTPYAELNGVLDELVTRTQSILQDNFVGAYLQGSFAVGDFDEHSDCDFIIVIEHELSPAEVEALRVVHAEIPEERANWAKHLEGSYFPRAVLKDYRQAGGNLWYVDHGSRELEESDHCNKVLVRWVVREHGLTLAGPPPESLVDPMPVAALRSEILGAIRLWGREIEEDSEHFANRWYQGYIVLNLSRMLHDLHTGQPGSKLAGANWAKEHLDAACRELIDRAWLVRPDPATSVHQPADPDDFAATVRYVAYIVQQANDYAKDNGIE